MNKGIAGSQGRWRHKNILEGKFLQPGKYKFPYPIFSSCHMQQNPEATPVCQCVRVTEQRLPPTSPSHCPHIILIVFAREKKTKINLCVSRIRLIPQSQGAQWAQFRRWIGKERKSIRRVSGCSPRSRVRPSARPHRKKKKKKATVRHL